MKVNGFRIEIGEIENRLLRSRDRDGAIVVAGAAERPYLAGFHTGGDAVTAGDLRTALAAVLPSFYMVPQRLYRLDALPLTANGKTDRKALARLAAEAGTHRGRGRLRGPGDGPPSAGSPPCGPTCCGSRRSGSAAGPGSPSSAAPPSPPSSWPSRWTGWCRWGNWPTPRPSPRWRRC